MPWPKKLKKQNRKTMIKFRAPLVKKFAYSLCKNSFEDIVKVKVAITNTKDIY